MNHTGPRPKVLFVDDEPALLRAMSRLLQNRFEVIIAESGPSALKVLEHEKDIVAIVSDMRMPVMSGAVFLSRAREVAPDATRILLTGYAEQEIAMTAVNEGQIFRYLEKPCDPPRMISTLLAAVEQHRLVTAERVLLAETLNGTIQALLDVLALAHPVAFGRAMRIRSTAAAVARKLAMHEAWQVEIAAAFSQLGSVALPAAILAKTALSRAEQQTADAVTAKLLARIPRLDTIRAIVEGALHPAQEISPALRRSAEVVRACIELETRGVLSTFSPAVVAAIDSVRQEKAQNTDVRELPVGELAEGMQFARDVQLESGELLVAHGTSVTPALVERLRNCAPSMMLQMFVARAASA
jgi:response regulator RpfG family c-di-GMP phosphodiesterase